MFGASTRPSPSTLRCSSASRCSALAISAGWTLPLKIRVKARPTMPSSRRSKRCSTPTVAPLRRHLTSDWGSEPGEPRLTGQEHATPRGGAVGTGPGRPLARLPETPCYCPSSPGQVAEWQTRTVQVRVSERTWGFNSPLAHISLGDSPGARGGRDRHPHGGGDLRHTTVHGRRRRARILGRRPRCGADCARRTLRNRFAMSHGPETRHRTAAIRSPYPGIDTLAAAPEASSPVAGEAAGQRLAAVVHLADRAPRPARDGATRTPRIDAQDRPVELERPRHPGAALP